MATSELFILQTIVSCTSLTTIDATPLNELCPSTVPVTVTFSPDFSWMSDFEDTSTPLMVETEALMVGAARARAGSPRNE